MDQAGEAAIRVEASDHREPAKGWPALCLIRVLTIESGDAKRVNWRNPCHLRSRAGHLSGAMITSERVSLLPSTKDDAALVSDALAGNRRAFGEIVGRYQTLICSMAYSATGNLSQSED